MLAAAVRSNELMFAKGAAAGGAKGNVLWMNWKAEIPKYSKLSQDEF